MLLRIASGIFFSVFGYKSCATYLRVGWVGFGSSLRFYYLLCGRFRDGFRIRSTLFRFIVLYLFVISVALQHLLLLCASQRETMPLTKPFFRIHSTSNRDLVDRTGVTFRIENINKEDEEVAHSTRLPSHYYLYYPNMNFLTKYADKLPIGDLLTWKTRKDLDVWMNRQIYFSHNIQQSKFHIHHCSNYI
ncbi:hypothetical protein RHGRI_033622 [Rhododendron griersonianum]|uniref:Uncharacterized protein n=1 Tax=Rhododendron griersonianum TaxID=479676 RepID=A0AAV6HXH3_9ERIC|nr:hypothetical protein RHGRI_033622 [Rhododendron griersonianum]